jgi:hypothetical protein
MEIEEPPVTIESRAKRTNTIINSVGDAVVN